MGRGWLTGGVVAVAAALGGAYWFQTRDRVLSEVPERTAAAAAVPEAPSNLQVQLTIPTALAAARLEAAIPASHTFSGRERICVNLKKTLGSGEIGKFIGFVLNKVIEEEICQDAQYALTLSRGAAAVRPLGDRIEVLLPVTAEGRAGLTGEVAEALDLDGKNVRGALNIVATASVEIDENWCPMIATTVDFTWTERAKVEVIGDWWVNVASKVEPELRKLIDKGLEQLESSLTCAVVREAVEPIWTTRNFRLTFPGGKAGAPDVAHLHLRPVSLGLSGIHYGHDAIALWVRAGLVTEVRSGPPPAAESAGALPKLARLPAGPGRLELRLPVRADYATLVAELGRRFAGSVHEAATPAGQVRVTLHELTLYPAGDRLAVGLRFTAETPGQLLDMNGWIYLTGRPEIVGDTTLRVSDLTFARQLDNRTWSALSAVFEQEIVAGLGEAATIDLAPQVSLLDEEIDAVLDKLADDSGIRVTLEDRDVRLAALVLTDTTLEAVAEFGAVARVTALSLDGDF